jgi:hypothetical protein
MSTRRFRILTIWLAVFALALGACSDSSNSPEPIADTTPPLVAGTSPSDGQIAVSTNAAITVTFNEAMAPASATGQVTLSAGGAPTITWLSDRQFRITHSATWTEGVEIHVTLGTGLTDAAGNALAESYVFSFFTETSTLLLLNTDPADNAAGVNRSANIRLQFSLPVDENSLATSTTITDGVTKTSYPFTVSSGDNHWYTLDPTTTLPSGTLLTVTVTNGVFVYGSPLNFLNSTAVFHFTTGVDVDTTPPTILSFSPANNATNVPVDVGMMVITFSEPVDPASFDQTAWNLEFARLILGNSVEPIWSQGNTVVTVALPTLPAGLEMEITFSTFRDASGNLQTTEYTWNARVAGTADVWPMSNGLREHWYVDWARGLEGNTTPTESGSGMEYRQTEVQGNGDVRIATYDNANYATPRRWDTYDRLGSSVEWLGFTDGGDGGTPTEILFDTSLKFLPLPLAVGTWTDNATVTVPGQGTYTATFNGRVFARADLPVSPLKSKAMSYYFKGAWKVARTMEVHLDGVWFTTQTDTVWYSQTLGPVYEVTREDSPARDGNPAGWYRTSGWYELSSQELIK